MISEADVKIQSPNDFYNDFQLNEEELEWLQGMAEEGLGQQALDIFIEAYIVSPGTKYQDVVTKYMIDSSSGVIPSVEANHLVRNIVLLSIGLMSLLTVNFNKFLRKSYSPQMFADSGLRNAEVKASILKEVLSMYDSLIRGATTQTQTFVVSSIRTLQREMITKNFSLKRRGITGARLNFEIREFKKGLRSKYPSIYKAMEKGNILALRNFGVENEKIRHYKLDYYVDLTTRTTILNADRNTIEIMATANEERVVGFRLGDPRIVKEERVICQEILNTKILGESVLALDKEAGKKLGIMTVEQARETPDFSFGPYCRHVLERKSKNYLKEVDKMLEAA